jgi:predicted permease
MRLELRPGVRRLFRLAPRDGDELDADIDEEIDALIAHRVDALVARGLTREQARLEALHRLGATIDDARRQLHHSARRRERRMHLREYLETVVQDLRYAARGLARRPGFTAVAALTLAIGIGATTAIFSAVNVLLLRPLPYVRPDELMKLSLIVPARGERPGMDDMVWSYPKYTVLRDAQRSFGLVVLYSDDQVTLSSGDPERVAGEAVGARYFELLGIPLSRGRAFEPGIDAGPDAPRQVVISDALWQRRFNADPSIVGRVIEIDRQPWVVIGVAPPEFKGLTGQAQLFTPITARSARDLGGPQSHQFFAVARRKPGVTAAQAQSEMTALGKRISETYPNEYDNTPWGAKATALDDARLAPAVKQSLLVLFGAVGFVLLIACVNVAGLLLGRASARRREIAVRLAIGAGRGRLVRLMLAESTLLALIGGAASVAVAWLGVRGLATIDPANTLRVMRDSGLGAMAFSAIRLDWTALGFTFAVAMIVGLAFGLIPALSASSASLTGALKDDAQGRWSRFGGGTATRRLLVVAEVALAIVLLAGSGLMLRSLGKLLAIDPGFDGRGVLTFRLNIPPGGMARDSVPGFYAQVEERMRAIPGVSDVGLNNCTPLSGGCNGTGLIRLDRPKVDFGHAPGVGIHWASPTWFATMRIPLLRGRLMTDADRTGMPKVVVINDAAAKKIWPGEDPIGKHVALGQGGMEDAEVIGIVGSVRQQVDSEPAPDAYIAFAQAPRAGMVVFLRTSRNPSSLANEVRRAMHEIAPTLPVYDVRTMAERTAAMTARARFSATLLALFALTALSLAAIGIYGVMSLAVSARNRELGIRIALGADQARVKRLVIGEGAVLAAFGAAIGLVAALLATRAMRAMLYDLAPSDPMTYVAVMVLLALTAVGAAWLPARRASRVDPVEALRAD